MTERQAQNIVEKINARFPHAHAMVWNGQPMIGEQSMIVETVDVDGDLISTELPMVDYYAAGSRTYPNSMLREAEKFIDSLGLYGEWYDPGTMVLYEI